MFPDMVPGQGFKNKKQDSEEVMSQWKRRSSEVDTEKKRQKNVSENSETMAEHNLKAPKPLDISAQSPNTWDNGLQSYEW